MRVSSYKKERTSLGDISDLTGKKLKGQFAN